MANTLARLDRARTMLARARTLEDVKKIHDMAEAARTLMKAAHLGREAQYQAAEVALLAAHKAGQILKDLPRAKPKVKGGRVKDSPYWKAINDTGTSYRTAQRWQSIALVAPAILEKYIAYERNRDSGDISAAGLIRASKGKKYKRPSPYTHKIVVPVRADEWSTITQLASLCFHETEFLMPEAVFIRSLLQEYMKAMGITRPLQDEKMRDDKTLRQRLAEFLKTDPRHVPWEDSPLGNAVRKTEFGPVQD